MGSQTHFSAATGKPSFHPLSAHTFEAAVHSNGIIFFSCLISLSDDTRVLSDCITWFRDRKWRTLSGHRIINHLRKKWVEHLVNAKNLHMLPSHWRQAFTCKYVREKPEMGVRVICKYVNYVASSPITQRLSVPGSMLIHNDGVVAFRIQGASSPAPVILFHWQRLLRSIIVCFGWGLMHDGTLWYFRYMALPDRVVRLVLEYPTALALVFSLISTALSVITMSMVTFSMEALRNDLTKSISLFGLRAAIAPIIPT